MFSLANRIVKYCEGLSSEPQSLTYFLQDKQSVLSFGHRIPRKLQRSICFSDAVSLYVLLNWSLGSIYDIGKTEGVKLL